jgi:hypothetical protein
MALKLPRAVRALAPLENVRRRYNQYACFKPHWQGIAVDYHTRHGIYALKRYTLSDSEKSD